MENNILLGATGDVVAQYDNSGVVQPGSSAAPSDASVSQDESTSTDSTDSTDTGSNNLLMYAGAALLLYFFVFKAKK